ncbi:PAC2 family protein [Iamia majanohamensis]|uniref:PAC2 family protein n=1 Tax=Iamia majanohamensis TaxID=467976 RepID=A0AAE9YD89_9ACTN|nr:PAC2 family protein [Iamia majanohamensis]WCO68924.1 PAC2 family protein [Iamia majanohamensis]
MSAPYERAEHRPLRDPVLLMALEGWIDAGMAASTSIATLLADLDTEGVATFDADELLDHRARRPVLHLVAGVAESLSWPSIELLAAQDLAGRDVLILAGPEPDHSWRAFGRAVVELATELGVTQVVGLGAYPATVPHTRPVKLSITAGTEELAARWPYLRGTLDVPAGAQAVVERFATDAGLEALTLWAQIPHYASAWPYPAGSTALLDNIEAVTGLRLPRGDLEQDAIETGERLDSTIARNDEHTAMLHALEADADEAPSEGEIPSGDELAAELERFLRDQGGT